MATKKYKGLKSDGYLKEWFLRSDGAYEGLTFDHHTFNDGAVYVIHKDDIKYKSVFNDGIYLTMTSGRKYWLPNQFKRFELT